MGGDIKSGDRVITPSDEVAIVRQVDPLELRAELTYCAALSGNPENAQCSLPMRVLVAWPPGTQRPKPRRVAWKAAA